MLTVNTCYGKIDEEFMTRLSAIKLLAFDIDGTMTDGGIYYDNNEIELKKFNTKDGFGIASLIKENIECVAITGRESRLVERRMKDLHVKHIIQGEKDKAVALKNICANLGISTNEAICIGDDLNDMPMFREAGLCACPHDAHPFIRNKADYITCCTAGHGAVRELCDLILIAKGILLPDGGYADERY